MLLNSTAPLVELGDALAAVSGRGGDAGEDFVSESRFDLKRPAPDRFGCGSFCGRDDR